MSPHIFHLGQYPGITKSQNYSSSRCMQKKKDAIGFSRNSSLHVQSFPTLQAIINPSRLTPLRPAEKKKKTTQPASANKSCAHLETHINPEWAQCASRIIACMRESRSTGDRGRVIGHHIGLSRWRRGLLMPTTRAFPLQPRRGAQSDHRLFRAAAEIHNRQSGQAQRWILMLMRERSSLARAQRRRQCPHPRLSCRRRWCASSLALPFFSPVRAFFSVFSVSVLGRAIALGRGARYDGARWWERMGFGDWVAEETCVMGENWAVMLWELGWFLWVEVLGCLLSERCRAAVYECGYSSWFARFDFCCTNFYSGLDRRVGFLLINHWYNVMSWPNSWYCVKTKAPQKAITHS